MNITDLPDRVQAKVREEYGCWIWRAATNNRGYGAVSVSKNGTKLAHRYTYELLRGEIPGGLTIDHLCARKQCVNPWHMEPVTARINSARGDHRPFEPRVIVRRMSHQYVEDNLVWSCPYKHAIDHHPDLKDPIGWAAQVDAMDRLSALLSPALERKAS